MSDAGNGQIYRVTVKGKFVDLSDRARRYLVDSAEDHTYFKSAFTPEGTLVYDADVKFFSLRYEVRLEGDESSDAASRIAIKEAETFLTTMGFGFAKLRVFSVDDMAAIWTQ